VQLVSILGGVVSSAGAWARSYHCVGAACVDHVDPSNTRAVGGGGDARYDSICERMKVELPRIYAGLSVDLNEAFGNFLAVHSQLSTQTAAAWNAVQVRTPLCESTPTAPHRL
jgi:hypothetical protein